MKNRSKGFLAGLLAGLFLLLSLGSALAGGTILPNGRKQFIDENGQPLNGGQVFYFFPGTTTPSPTWQDPNLLIQNSNPITLDGLGTALVYGIGNYREVVQSAAGVQLWDQLTQQLASVADSQTGVYLWGGLSSGGGNSYSISTTPLLDSLTAGQTVRFIVNQTNTGASTINVNGTGFTPITKFGTTPLNAGDIATGQTAQITYDGSSWQMTSAPGGTSSLINSIGVGLFLNSGSLSVDLGYWQNHISGLTLFNDGGAAGTTVDINPGAVTDDTDNFLMKYLNVVTKTTAAWAAGSGNGCMDTGSVATTQYYAVYAILRPDTLANDILCSLSAVSPTMPANYTAKRRIGFIRTDGSANIRTFAQNGDVVLWGSPFLADITTAALGTTPTFFTLAGVPAGTSAPNGVTALMTCQVSLVAGAVGVLVYSPYVADPANTGSGNREFLTAGANLAAAGQIRIVADSSGRVKALSSAASTTLTCTTQGYVDPRGRY